MTRHVNSVTTHPPKTGAKAGGCRFDSSEYQAGPNATDVLSPVYLSLPETTSGSIDDEDRQGSAERQAGHTAGPADGLANPCPATDAFEVRCNSRCRPQGC